MVGVSFLVLTSVSAFAAPPPDPSPSGPQPTVADAGDDAAAADLEAADSPESAVKPPATREEAERRFESALTKLGTIGTQARERGEMELLDCVRDKQSRAANVADLFAAEEDVLDSPNASDAQRAFALEKLGEATLQMEQLYGLGRVCAGDLGPEDQVNQTRTRAQEPRLIPLLDPTLGLGASPVPAALPVDWLPTASPTE